MSRKAMMSYYLFWRMYEGVIDRTRFEELFGIKVERAFPLMLGLSVAMGHAHAKGDSYVLTRRGLDLFHTLERWVTYQFIEPTWAACRSAPYPKTLRL